MNNGPFIEELPSPKVQVIPPVPLRPVDPLNLGQLQRARELLQDPSLSVASALKFNKDVLRVLCDESNVSYPGKSQKLDLVEKLFTAVSRIAHKPFGISDWLLAWQAFPTRWRSTRGRYGGSGGQYSSFGKRCSRCYPSRHGEDSIAVLD